MNAVDALARIPPDRALLIFGDASSVHTQRWAREMVARGHVVVVATRLPAAIEGVAAVVPLQPGRDGAGWFRALPAVRRLAGTLRPRIVHGHYVTGYGLWAAACGWGPVVQTAWGSDILVTPRESAVMRHIVGWSLRRADLMTADSQDALDAMALFGDGAVAPRHEILWGADTERFVPAADADNADNAANAAIPDEHRPFRILSLRSWEPNYHIDVLIDAVARVRAARPGRAVMLELLGGGPDADALKARAAAAGLGPDVARFTGRVGDAAMVAAMQAADVSVTVPGSDATSVSLLESLACGLPIVASDLPANRRWVGAQAGVIVPVRDGAELADALLALLDDPARRRAMSRHNRALALREASRRVQMDRMDALYRQLPPSGPRRLWETVR
ncbi:glycosyltransferase [Sphaerotilus mobilis]|uniref:Glycosyltransferase involved in cell wall biosynthesis n=1 Tax=Sphaerotilus mobilis TaxID=47994 RepID=A0A4Q7LJV2_9BURK|nr:glycosyltransferase [Sphaerotilus mobilis]RZS54392.1 glycosyltransferase involved in cell wall biosynthesis [Sphaerotilus mobilis]